MLALIYPLAVTVLLWCWCRGSCSRASKTGNDNDNSATTTDDDDQQFDFLTEELDSNIYKRVAKTLHNRKKPSSTVSSVAKSIFYKSSSIGGGVFQRVFAGIANLASCGVTTLGCCAKIIVALSVFIFIWILSELAVELFAQKFVRL